MADLGAIAREWKKPDQRPTLSTLVRSHYVGEDVNPLDVDATGVISGVLSIGAVPRGGVKVLLLYRSSGQQAAVAVTAADGSYQFLYLDKTDLGAYCVVFLDPQVAPVYNFTLARDHLTAG